MRMQPTHHHADGRACGRLHCLQGTVRPSSAAELSRFLGLPPESHAFLDREGNPERPSPDSTAGPADRHRRVPELAELGVSRERLASKQPAECSQSRTPVAWIHTAEIIRVLAPRYEKDKEERRVPGMRLSHKYYNKYTYYSKSDDIENRVSGSL